MKVFNLTAGIASILGFAVGIYSVVNGDPDAQRNAAFVLGAGFFIALAISLLFFKQDMTTWRGRVEITNSSDFEKNVNYPKAFANLPNHRYWLKSGHGATASLALVEERVDGFRFKFSNLRIDSGHRAYVEWSAKGVPTESAPESLGQSPRP